METQKTKKTWVNWFLFIVTVVIVFLLGLLASSINERKAEATVVDTPKHKLSEFEPRNEIWGENYPREFQSYYQTSDTSFRSKYNGGAMIDMLEIDPRLVVLWAGYGFSKDYNQGRGHYYAVTDINNTLRTGGPTDAKGGPMPSTCWTCKSPDVPRLMDEIGIKDFYKGTWASKGAEIHNPIGCADCHNPNSMNLRISRPALKEAFTAMGKDIKDATQNEMRSLVCAQCHVEYYFDKSDGETPYLTFPWKNGMTVEAAEEYYDNIEFSDWTHSLSKAPMLKAQHPGYEIYMKGIHAERGVSCADCHMPYISEGGQKYTSHKIQSPLNHIDKACQVCHRESEQTLLKNVIDRQNSIIEIRDRAEVLLVKAHVEAKAAWDAGATEEEMKNVLTLIRHSQWRWDYAAASHGGSFHAPIETARIIGTSIEKSQEARILLSKILLKYGINEVDYPDIDTKAKAQSYIGLDMTNLKSEKNAFLNGLLIDWITEAEAREKTYQPQLDK